MEYAYWRTDKAKEDGFSHELIANESKDLLVSTNESLDLQPYEGVDTVLKALRRTAERIPDANYLGTRDGAEYKWMSWKECLEYSENFSHGAKALDLCPEVDGEGDDKKWRFMGIQSKNRKEWNLINAGGMFQNVCSVPLYDTLGEEAARFIFWQTQMTTISLSKDMVAKLCKLKTDDNAMAEADQKINKLANMVVFEDDSEDVKETIEAAGLKYFKLSDVVAKGVAEKAAGNTSTTEATPDDAYMLSFTSGTTGIPKGVKCTHKMLINDSYAIKARISGPNFHEMDENDVYISYLPASHIFEQVLHGMSIIYGIQCGFFAGDVAKITEDCNVLKPTFFPSVPRLYNRFYGLLNAKFKSGTPEEVAGIAKAVEVKLTQLREGKGFVHEQFDAAVFSKVKPMLGGRVRALLTGSAPISKEVMEFFTICFSCDFIEGYGMTENCAGACIGKPGDAVFGHTGGPLQHIKIKLRDIPEMNYLHTNETAEGELLFQGSSIMPGYFKNPEKTVEAIKDGWLYTGDVGRVFANGSVKVIDRVKNIFKLSQGEYIAPEKLENVFVQSDFVLQAWMYGDSLRDYVVGFLVVEPMVMKKVFSGGAEDFQITEELLNDDKTKQAVLDQLWNLATEQKFNSLEKPKQITLLAKPFNEINPDMLTPTFKMKRNVAKEFFKEQISKMYDAPPMSATKK